MASTYFTPTGVETLSDVVYRYEVPLKLPAIYNHMKRHQWKDLQKAEEAQAPKEVTLPSVLQPPIVAAVEGEVVSTQDHEVGLDDFIRKGREKLMADQLPITATTYLQAIKIKADIDKNTKDRRLDAVKSLFKGAAPKQDEPETV